MPAKPVMPKQAAPRPKILIILHQEHSTAGRIGRMLRAQGCDLDIRRPRFGDALPARMDDHAGAMIFGGPMSANDEEDYIRTEIDWIGVPLKAQKPFLGICLGAQMLARHFGGRVYGHPQGRVEIGYYPVEATSAGHAACPAPFPGHVYQWHREGFDLPRGGVLLAQGQDFAVQACQSGPAAFGIQFHPEVTYAMICRWTTVAADRMDGPGAHPRQNHLEGWFRHDAALSRWSAAFLKGWVGHGDSHSGTARF